MLYFHLLPALFAALLVYGGTRALAARLERARPGLRHAQTWGLLLLEAGLGGLGSVVVERAAEAAAGGGYVGLLQQMASALEQFARCCRRGSRRTCRSFSRRGARRH